MTAAELGEISVQIGLVLQRRPGPPTVASEPGIPGVHHVGAALSSASTARPEPQTSLEVAPVWCVCARKCFACGRDWCSEPGLGATGGCCTMFVHPQSQLWNCALNLR